MYFKVGIKTGILSCLHEYLRVFEHKRSRPFFFLVSNISSETTGQIVTKFLMVHSGAEGAKIVKMVQVTRPTWWPC